MEPEVREFFKRIGKSLGIGLLWLSITTIAAISGDNAFISGGVTLANILFYTWLIISIAALVVIYKKMWSKHFDRNNAAP